MNTEFRSAIQHLAPLGWAMCGSWPVEDTLKVLRLARSGTSPEIIDETITEFWNTKNRSALSHAVSPIRKWSNSYYPFKQILWDRVALLEKAIEHHFAGSYEASIPILHAQIEGLSIDLTGRSFFSKSKGSHPYLDDASLAGMEDNLPIVRVAFSRDVSTTGSFGYLSRHGVLHGRDLGYATRVNSTKTIVLAAALAEYFPRLAEDAGTLQLQTHNRTVAGSQDVSETGRLIDDRKLQDLIRFTWEFDLAYAGSVLFNTQSFNPQSAIEDIAEKHGFSSSQFIVAGGIDCNWWYTTLPAQHVMGYAARPSTNQSRRHPDVWRWDSSEAPMAPPWVNPDGWQSDDTFPRSPNREPEVVI